MSVLGLCTFDLATKYGRCLTQVYTVNMESRYLLVMNVPALGATKSLLEQMALYGEIEE